jgi:hypothetical protein
MRPIFVVGLAVLVLGILSFVVPFPHSETHGAKIGDTNIGITTHSSKTLPPVVGGVLVAAGVVLVIAGARKGA